MRGKFIFMIRKIVKIVLLSMLFSNSSYAETKNPDSEVTEDIKKYAKPIKSIEPDSSCSDITNILETLKNYRFIGLGEGSHGTSEFFRVKHKLYKCFVEKLDFKVFAIEASTKASKVIDDYIKTGKSDYKEALLVNSVWNTKEMINFIEWMREYNKKADEKNKISYIGFDTFLSDESINIISDFLKEIDLEKQKKFLEIYKLFNNEQLFSASNKNVKTQVFEELEFIKKEIIKNSNSKKQENLIYHITLIEDILKFWNIDYTSTNGFKESIILRDELMARQIKYSSENNHKNKKIAIWAHNAHINNATEQGPFKDVNLMGFNLKTYFKNDYYILGLLFSVGSIKSKVFLDDGSFSKESQENPILEPEKESINYLFHETKIPYFFIDLKKIPDNSVFGKWLLEPKLIRNITAVYSSKFDAAYYSEFKINTVYDGFIYIDKSTPKLTNIINNK